MNSATKKLLILAVLYLGFISLGLPDQILGVAWPSMRLEFAKPLDYAGILVSIYTVFSAISGYLGGYFISKFSLRRILIVSSFLTVVGIFGYGMSPNWYVVILFAVPFGLGAGAIDSALNNYVAINYSSKHMNWLHGFWGIGSTLGPLILTGVFAMGLSWRIGYFTIASIQLLLVLIFILTRNLWNEDKKIEKPVLKNTNIASVGTFLSALFFFLYVSTEASIGLWYYSVLVEQRNVPIVVAGSLITAYWAFLTIGRFFTGSLTAHVKDKTIITFGLLLALVAMVFLSVNSNLTHVLGLVIVGFGLAGIYPCMMNETHKRFDTNTAQILMGHQVGSASLGFAIMVPLIGVLIQRLGLNSLIPILSIILVMMLLIDLKIRKLSAD